MFFLCLDWDNKWRRFPAAHHGGSDGGEMGGRLHHASSVSFPPRNEVYSLLGLRAYCLRWPAKIVSTQPDTHASLSRNITRGTTFYLKIVFIAVLTLSSLNLPLPSSSSTSRELMSQFQTCSGWRWIEVGDKRKMSLLLKQCPRCRKLGYFSEMQNDVFMHCEGLKG